MNYYPNSIGIKTLKRDYSYPGYTLDTEILKKLSSKYMYYFEDQYDTLRHYKDDSVYRSDVLDKENLEIFLLFDDIDNNDGTNDTYSEFYKLDKGRSFYDLLSKEYYNGNQFFYKENQEESNIPQSQINDLNNKNTKKTIEDTDRYLTFDEIHDKKEKIHFVQSIFGYHVGKLLNEYYKSRINKDSRFTIKLLNDPRLSGYGKELFYEIGILHSPSQNKIKEMLIESGEDPDEVYSKEYTYEYSYNENDGILINQKRRILEDTQEDSQEVVIEEEVILLKDSQENLDEILIEGSEEILIEDSDISSTSEEDSIIMDSQDSQKFLQNLYYTNKVNQDSQGDVFYSPPGNQEDHRDIQEFNLMKYDNDEQQQQQQTIEINDEFFENYSKKYIDKMVKDTQASNENYISDNDDDDDDDDVRNIDKSTITNYNELRKSGFTKGFIKKHSSIISSNTNSRTQSPIVEIPSRIDIMNNKMISKFDKRKLSSSSSSSSSSITKKRLISPDKFSTFFKPKTRIDYDSDELEDITDEMIRPDNTMYRKRLFNISNRYLLPEFTEQFKDKEEDLILEITDNHNIDLLKDNNIHYNSSIIVNSKELKEDNFSFVKPEYRDLIKVKIEKI